MLRAGAVFAVSYPLYKLGMLGAGDVKLYSMSTAFLTGEDCVAFLAGSLLFAAAAACVKLFTQRNLWERLGYFCSYLVDVLRQRDWRLYLEEAGFAQKKKASLHLAGPMLAGLLFHMLGVY